MIGRDDLNFPAILYCNILYLIALNDTDLLFLSWPWTLDHNVQSILISAVFYSTLSLLYILSSALICLSCSGVGSSMEEVETLTGRATGRAGLVS